MKLFVFYNGCDSKQGSYFTKGLTIGKYYEWKSSLMNLVRVINDYGKEETYDIRLFE